MNPAPPPVTGGGRDEPADDRELMAAHVAGDDDAFSELVRRHRQRLYALATRTLRDREEAADAVQDALIKAFRGAGSYRGDAEVVAWLGRIVVNVCVDRIRARKGVTVPLDDDRGEDNQARDTRGDAFEDIDAQLAARQLLEALPDEQRLPILLVDVHGYSVAEAATRLGVPTGTVKSRCARGRARLAATLLERRSSSSSAEVHARRRQEGGPR